VGKDITARAIHAISQRKHNDLVIVNCGAIPEGIIESELFGHEKGSFTGAHEAREGYFEKADGGTIFLDEIGEMPMSTQARLLRVLEMGEFIKVGSSKVLKTDVRVIAASNVDLLKAVEQKKFREDLYYRLNTVPIKVPPLRERKEDIHLLFRKFSVDFAEKYRTTPIRLSEEAVEVLENYKWPGNVRELKNVVEQISVISTNKDISAKELQNFLNPFPGTSLPAVREDHNKDSVMSEREILYKLLFEMRKDINDLKSFVLKNTGYKEVPSVDESAHQAKRELQDQWQSAGVERSKNQQHSPIVIDEANDYSDTEEIEEEESLSIAEKEKELIKKALARHRGKRKNAARDLGISERTLYRKIKEYEIAE
jgi:DNA-binding NtrC family response regulator